MEANGSGAAGAAFPSQDEVVDDQAGSRFGKGGVSAEGAPVPRTARARRFRWLRSLAIVVLLCLLGLGALFGRLTAGPLTTELGTTWAADRLAAVLGPGATASIGVIGLSLDDGLDPILHLRDVSLSDPAQGSVSVDTAAIGIGWGTLFGGRADLRAVVAEHVLVGARDSGDPMPAIPDLLAGIDRLVASSGIGLLDIGALTLDRRSGDAGRRTILSRIGATAERDSAGAISVRLTGQGKSGAWRVTARMEPGEGPVFRRGSISTAGLDIVDIAGMAGDDLPPVVGPVGFEGRFGFTEDWRLAEGEGDLVLGPVLENGPETPALLADRSRLKMRWRDGDGRFVVDPSTILLPGGGHALAQGEVTPPKAADEPWGFAFVVDGDIGGRSGGGQVEGSYDPLQRSVVVDRLQLSGVGATFNAAMRLDHSGPNPIGALSGVFEALSVDALKRIWPAAVSPDARRWVSENVISGDIEGGSLDVGFAGGAGRPAADATLTFRFKNLVFRPYDDGPMIRDGIGTGRLEGDVFTVELESGTIDLEQGRMLAITESRFLVPSVAKNPPDGEVSLSISGSAEHIGVLWGRVPISERVDLGFDPAGLSGRARAEIRLELPLIKDVKAEQMTYVGSIDFEDLAIAEPVDGRRIRKGDILVNIAEGSVTVIGTAEIDGVAATVDLVRPLEGDGEAAGVVSLDLDAAARARFGFDLGSAVEGTVKARVETNRDDAGRSRQRVTLDLAQATVSLPAAGFSKAKGRPGRATFELESRDGRVDVRDIRVAMGGAVIEGSMSLDAKGRLIRGDFPVMRLSSGDSLSLTIGRDGDATTARVEGRRFDASSLVSRRLKNQADGAVPLAPVELTVAIGSVTGLGDEEIRGFNVAARIEGGVVAAMSLTGQTEGGGEMSATITPIQGGRRLRAEVGEVGRLLRFLGVYGRIFGGRATVAGVIDPNGSIRAEVDGWRWKIVEEPALARLSTAAPDGPTAGFATADIERLRGDLTFGGGVLSIADGVVRTTGPGLTLQGDIDFQRGSLRLAGSYMPASAFDSLLGKIPLLGQTVFAGGRAGLIGVSFRLSGPIQDPALTINPLSIVAPGIFRKLFELE